MHRHRTIGERVRCRKCREARRPTPGPVLTMRRAIIRMLAALASLKRNETPPDGAA